MVSVEPDGGAVLGPREKVLRPSTAYGIALAMAYAMALALAMGMVFVFQTPQPALLYIVPLVLLVVISEWIPERSNGPTGYFCSFWKCLCGKDCWEFGTPKIVVVCRSTVSKEFT